MEITKQLQELAKCTTDPFLVLSVYLNTADHAQRQQSLHFLRQRLHQAHTLAVAG
jgi:hypothetical protein